MLDQNSPDLQYDASKTSPSVISDTEMEHLEEEETKKKFLHQNMNIQIMRDQQKPLEQKNEQQDQKISFLNKLQANIQNVQIRNQITVQKSIIGFDISDEIENHFDSDNFIPITLEDK